MGTRSLTVVKERLGKNEKYETLATIYRHFDGYPAAQGVILVECFDLFNSRSRIDTSGRFACTLIERMQAADDCGLNPPELMAENTVCGQEYVYVVLFTVKSRGLRSRLKCTMGSRHISVPAVMNVAI